MKNNIYTDYSLKELNTFAVDVKTKYYIEFNSVEELLEILKDEILKNNKAMILGGGSNVLFTSDFDGVVLKNNILGIEVIEETADTVIVKVGGGENWDRFVEHSVAKGWSGIENLSLIPGTVGASPIQNIGAYGVEVKDVIKTVDIIELDTLNQISYSNSECKFGYRDSIFKNEMKSKTVVTSVVFNLNKKQSANLSYEALLNELKTRDIVNPTIEQVRQVIIDIRNSKLPSEKEYPNAGSFFKNPEIDRNEFLRLKNEFDDLKYFQINDDLYKIPSGWMIDKCGLKGYKEGNVGTFDKQALVIVNYNNASGGEIKEFSEMIKQKVFDKFGINIETEVNIF